jgi:hypothetical protein
VKTYFLPEVITKKSRGNPDDFLRERRQTYHASECNLNLSPRHSARSEAKASEVAESTPPFQQKIVGVPPRFFGYFIRPKVGVYFWAFFLL